MTELDQHFIKRINDDLAKNPDYKLFMEKDNYISEEAVQYVFFILDHYVKNGGKVNVTKIRHLFGMNESKAELIVKILKEKSK